MRRNQRVDKQRKTALRPCLKCGCDFWSSGIENRLCGLCRAENEYVNEGMVVTHTGGRAGER